MLSINKKYIPLILSGIILPFLLSDTIILNYTDLYFYFDKIIEIRTDKAELFATYSRTNLFPYILHIFLDLFGNELTRLKFLYCFFALIIAAECYFFGRILYKNNSGVITAALLLTSYQFTNFLYFPHIDFPLLMSINCCLLLILYIIQTSNRPHRLLMFASGLLIGASFCLKESSIWLLLLIPTYALIHRGDKIILLKNWIFQLIPFLIVGGYVILLSDGGFAFRYSQRVEMLYNALVSDNHRVLVTHWNYGWEWLDESFDSPFWKLLIYLFIPIMWPWTDEFPVPRLLITFEQVMIIGCFIHYLIHAKNEKIAKIFFISVLLIYLPRYFYITLAGLKYRQLLPFFFILYIPLGHLLYQVAARIKISLQGHIGEKKSYLLAVFLLLFFYLTRLGLFFNGIDYSFTAASAAYERPDPLQIQFQHPGN